MPYPLINRRDVVKSRTVAPTYYLLDTFYDANSVALQSHTMDKGPGWTIGSGTFDIQGNKAGGSAVAAYAYSNAGQADVVIDTDVTWGGSYGSVLLRYSGGNYYYLFIQVSQANGYWYSQAAQVTDPFAITACASNSTHHIKIIISANVIKLFLDGVCVSCRMALTQNQSATSFGIRATARHAHFTVTPSTGALTNMLVCDGDSLTDGHTVQPLNQSYPEKMGVLYPNWKVVQLGVAGNTTTQLLARESTTTAYASSGYKYLAVLCGINDIFGIVPLATTKSNLLAYWAAARTAGFKVIACTLTASQYASQPGDADTQRGVINTWILTQSAQYDAVADLAADATIGAYAGATNTTYFQTDKVHLVTAGYAILAGIVKAAIDSLGA